MTQQLLRRRSAVPASHQRFEVPQHLGDDRADDLLRLVPVQSTLGEWFSDVFYKYAMPALPWLIGFNAGLLVEYQFHVIYVL